MIPFPAQDGATRVSFLVDELLAHECCRGKIFSPTLFFKAPMQWQAMASELLSELIMSLSLFLEQIGNQDGEPKFLVMSEPAATVLE